MNILSFADDTTASFPSHDVAQLYNKTNDELKKLNDWFCANKLSLNAKKTKYILFRQNMTHPNIDNRHIILNEHNVDIVGNTHKCTPSNKLERSMHIPNTESHQLWPGNMGC